VVPLAKRKSFMPRTITNVEQLSMSKDGGNILVFGTSKENNKYL
jgi:hypothetical protein